MDLLTLSVMLLTSQWTLTILTEASPESTAGLKVTISKSGLAHINRAVVADIFGDLKNHTFPAQSGGSEAGSITFSFSNVQTADVRGLTSELTLLPDVGLYWRGLVDLIKVTTSYSTTYELDLFLGTVPFTVSGSVTADIRDITASLILGLDITPTGTLTTRAGSCNTTVGSVDLDFTGSILDWVLEKLTDFFEPDIRRLVGKEICDAVELEIQRTSKALENIQTSVSLTIMDVPVTMDYRFEGVEVGDDYITTLHMGEVFFEDESAGHIISTNEFPSSGYLSGVHMFGMSLREEVINQLLQTLVPHGLFSGGLGMENVLPEYKPLFQMACTKSTPVCLGMSLPATVQQSSDGVLKIKVEIQNANVSINVNSAITNAHGRLHFLVVQSGKADTLFSGDLHIITSLRFGIRNNLLAVRTQSIGGRLVIDDSSIGKIMDPKRQTLVNMATQQLKNAFLQNMNAWNTEFPITLPPGLGLKDTSIVLLPGIVHVEGNVCFKENACEDSDTISWTGKDLHESQKGVKIVENSNTMKSSKSKLDLMRDSDTISWTETDLHESQKGVEIVENINTVKSSKSKLDIKIGRRRDSDTISSTGKDLHESQKGVEIVENINTVNSSKSKLGNDPFILGREYQTKALTTSQIAGIVTAITGVFAAVVVVAVAFLIYRRRKRDIADIVAYDNTVQTGVNNPGYAQMGSAENIYSTPPHTKGENKSEGAIMAEQTT